MIWSTLSPIRKYALGDIIYLNVMFSHGVTFSNNTNLMLSNLQRPVYYEYQSDSVTGVFPYTVQSLDDINGLTYPDGFALKTLTSCDIQDTNRGGCAAQNLPNPSTNGDKLSPLKLVIDQTPAVINDVNIEYTKVTLGLDSSPSIYGIPLHSASLPSSSQLGTPKCEPNGQSFFYHESIDLINKKRVIYTTSCPNHFSICQTRECQQQGNLSLALPKTTEYAIPLYPVISSIRSNLTCVSGDIAVALNGVGFGSLGDGSSTCDDIVRGQRPISIDKCGGYGHSTGEYRYYVPPVCLLQQLGESVGRHSPLIGWALDGFPIYGSYGTNGTMMVSCTSLGSKYVPGVSVCLDACNGYGGPLNGVDDYLYRYYIAGGTANGNCNAETFQDFKHIRLCQRADDSCCVSSIPDPATFKTITLGCYAGCLLSDTRCQRLNKVSNGWTSNFVPTIATYPSVAYNNTPATIESVVRSTIIDRKMYSPSIWDSVARHDIIQTPGISLNASQPIAFFTSGSSFRVIVSFTEAVVVEGRPYVEMYLGSKLIKVFYKEQRSIYELAFEMIIDSTITGGSITCTRDSRLQLNGGRIMRLANFLPVLEAEIETSLGVFCCQDSCYVNATINSDPPLVSRVYSPTSGTYSTTDQISIYVEFNSPIIVQGSPALLLDMKNYPVAEYITKLNSKTLAFLYTVTSNDYTSTLEYANTSSLIIISNGLYDGIFKAGSFARINANLTLPYRGSYGSLGRESIVTIDNNHPNLVLFKTNLMILSAGDDLIISMQYDVPVNVYDAAGSAGVPIDGPSSELQLEFGIIIASSADAAPIIRRAIFSDVKGDTINFIYRIRTNDPTGLIEIVSVTPLVFRKSFIGSVSNHAPGQIKFDSGLINFPISSIDNKQPLVIDVYSSNSTLKYPWGPGDVIDIFVVMNIPVVTITTPTLQLSLNNGVKVANYVNSIGALYVTELHFRYVIQPGDVALPLEYSDQYALNGDIRRYSTNEATIIANLLLPPPFTLGSIGYCCNVEIDSSPPYIKSIVPLKRPDVYGENETIVIVATFNKPIVVQGVPSLLLKTGYDSSTASMGIAIYIPSFKATDLMIDLEESAVLFKYVVRSTDNVLDLTFFNSSAFFLPYGASITHRTMSPTTPADITLRDPSDFTLVRNVIDRQWLYRFPSKIEVILRDLYHSDPISLDADLLHSGKSASIFSECCGGKTFGVSYPSTRLANNATKYDIDTGIGYTYLFSDTLMPNIALKGYATQSSTNLDAKYALDGNIDPLQTDQSVSETLAQTNSWWQVLLPAGSKVRSINIWARKKQVWVSPVIALTVKGLDQYPTGSYRLQVSNIDKFNSNYTATTGIITIGATDGEVKLMIESLKGIGKVQVSRITLEKCGVLYPGGCGSGGTEKGYGYSYIITFSSVQVAEPRISIIDVEYSGGPVKNGGINETMNKRYFVKLDYSVNLIMQGQNQEVSMTPTYAKGVISNDTSTAGTNEWLTPFYVMVFGVGIIPPTDLQSAVIESLWYTYVETIHDFKQIVIPKTLNASYVRIQRNGYGILSIAEVEIYENKLNTLTDYKLGSPIKPTPLTKPFQPQTSFFNSFGNLKFDGKWVVQISQQEIQPTSTRDGYSFSEGTISDVVLVITDLAGIVHAYYQDIAAEIISLPKYGTLSTTKSFVTSPYGDWRESFEVAESGQLLPKPGGDRAFGICNGVDTTGENGVRSGVDKYRHCTKSFGVGPVLRTYEYGALALQSFIRNERVVVYTPNLRYRGPDYFTYTIHDGLGIQNHIGESSQSVTLNEVTMHVRNCRKYDTMTKFNRTNNIHPLCTCGQTCGPVLIVVLLEQKYVLMLTVMKPFIICVKLA